MCLTYFHMYFVHGRSISDLFTRDCHCMSAVPFAQDKVAQNNSILFF